MGLHRTETEGAPLPPAAGEDAHTLTLPPRASERAPAGALEALTTALGQPLGPELALRVSVDATPPPAVTLTF